MYRKDSKGFEYQGDYRDFAQKYGRVELNEKNCKCVITTLIDEWLKKTGLIDSIENPIYNKLYHFATDFLVYALIKKVVFIPQKFEYWQELKKRGIHTLSNYGIKKYLAPFLKDLGVGDFYVPAPKFLDKKKYSLLQRAAIYYKKKENPDMDYYYEDGIMKVKIKKGKEQQVKENIKRLRKSGLLEAVYYMTEFRVKKFQKTPFIESLSPELQGELVKLIIRITTKEKPTDDDTNGYLPHALISEPVYDIDGKRYKSKDKTPSMKHYTTFENKLDTNLSNIIAYNHKKLTNFSPNSVKILYSNDFYSSGRMYVDGWHGLNSQLRDLILSNKGLVSYDLSQNMPKTLIYAHSKVTFDEDLYLMVVKDLINNHPYINIEEDFIPIYRKLLKTIINSAFNTESRLNAEQTIIKLLEDFGANIRLPKVKALDKNGKVSYIEKDFFLGKKSNGEKIIEKKMVVKTKTAKLTPEQLDQYKLNYEPKPDQQSVFNLYKQENNFPDNTPLQSFKASDILDSLERVLKSIHPKALKALYNKNYEFYQFTESQMMKYLVKHCYYEGFSILTTHDSIECKPEHLNYVLKIINKIWKKIIDYYYDLGFKNHLSLKTQCQESLQVAFNIIREMHSKGFKNHKTFIKLVNKSDSFQQDFSNLIHSSNFEDVKVLKNKLATFKQVFNRSYNGFLKERNLIKTKTYNIIDELTGNIEKKEVRIDNKSFHYKLDNLKRLRMTNDIYYEMESMFKQVSTSIYNDFKKEVLSSNLLIDEKRKAKLEKKKEKFSNLINKYEKNEGLTFIEKLGLLVFRPSSLEETYINILESVSLVSPSNSEVVKSLLLKGVSSLKQFNKSLKQKLINYFYEKKGLLLEEEEVLKKIQSGNEKYEVGRILKYIRDHVLGKKQFDWGNAPP